MKDMRNRPGYDCNGHYTGIDPFAPREPVTYQVTANGLVIAEFPNGYLADQFARKFNTTRAARGKVVSVKRSDGKVPFTSAPDFS